MIKRFLLGLAILTGLIAPVHAAGTISFSLSQQFDQYGKPLGGCKFYTIQAGTTSTPQNAYQDQDLTLALPNPQTCDAAGRLPQFFLADGSIKIRLTDKNGVQQIVADNILVIGPSSGGGGGGGQVDPTTIFQTGDTMWSEVDGTRSGWVRDNGRTIGSASSGATERANADTEALFNYLWQTFDNTICPVSGGRGASSAADWAANKTIGTPDKRGYIVGGLPTMGNADSGRLASVPVVSGSLTTPGSVIGETLHTLTAAEIPAHTHPNTATQEAHSHGITSGTNLFTGSGIGTADGSFFSGVPNTATVRTFTSAQPAITMNNMPNTGGGGAHNNVQKTVLGSFFRKL